MNRKHFGDSYDIVKRFFCERLQLLKYSTCADPMFRGDWTGAKPVFYRLLGVADCVEQRLTCSRSALLIDPDTGIADRRGRKYISTDRIIAELARYAVVFVFDQSFIRIKNASEVDQMQEKLRRLCSHPRSPPTFGFYYRSHAKFLFASRDKEQLQAIRKDLVECGIPAERFIDPPCSLKGPESAPLKSRTKAVADSH